jgi:hypothetical protein
MEEVRQQVLYVSLLFLLKTIGDPLNRGWTSGDIPRHVVRPFRGGEHGVSEARDGRSEIEALRAIWRPASMV